jgi:hypothetical protein
VQRAGTTWWYRMLCEHPGVQGAPEKELHYFDRFHDGRFSRADERGYERCFPRPRGMIAGEWTPRYMHDFWTPRLLAAAAPEAKILVLLRDPLDRYRSGIAHERSALAGAIARGRREYVEAMTANDALDRSLYSRQLERLFAAFERERVLILQYERCLLEPAREVRRTWDFLGLDASADAGAVVAAAGTRRAPTGDGVIAEAALDPAARSELACDAARTAALVPEIDLDLWPTAGGG